MSASLDNARANLRNELDEYFKAGAAADDVVEAIEIFVTNLILHSKEQIK